MDCVLHPGGNGGLHWLISREGGILEPNMLRSR